MHSTWNKRLLTEHPLKDLHLNWIISVVRKIYTNAPLKLNHSVFINCKCSPPKGGNIDTPTSPMINWIPKAIEDPTKPQWWNVFCENSSRLKALDYFWKNIQHRCLIKFWIRFWFQLSATQTQQISASKKPFQKLLTGHCLIKFDCFLVSRNSARLYKLVQKVQKEIFQVTL